MSWLAPKPARKNGSQSEATKLRVVYQERQAADAAKKAAEAAKQARKGK